MSRQSKAIALTLMTTFLMGMIPQSLLAEELSLEEGTPVRLKLVDTVTSSRNKEGDKITLKVVDDILALDGKTVLVQAGADAWGTVVEVSKRGRIGSKGELSLTIDGVKAVNGQKVPLRASINRQGSSQLGTVVALSLLVTPLFLLMRGKDAKIVAGTQLSAYIDRNTLITNIAPSTISPTTSSSEPSTGTILLHTEESKGTSSGSAQALQALEALRQQGFLTPEEYEAKKKTLLEKN